AGIFKLLFPQIIHGGNIVIIATSGALLSLFIVMYLTHGFTRLTTAAFLGSTSAVLMTLFLAKYAVVLTALTGFAS
ncbi:YibE/F family protein, partial [Streptococcus pneumoniae]|uniref:YibE/F family protein n=1 Tax=Streptococcus pneumoniae TaxID=1313 RepID=UPI00139D62E2